MHWFGTTVKDNKLSEKKILEIPTKVLQVWECKRCMNIIYQKKSNFFPFQTQREIKAIIELQNILVRISQCAQQDIEKIAFKNQHLQMTNKAYIYCKVCKDNQLLGEFVPNFNTKQVQFAFILVPEEQNIKKTTIITGKSNRQQLSQSEFMTNFPMMISNVPSLQRLRKLRIEIESYLLLWYQSKNFKLYEAFIQDSEKKRNDMEGMCCFMMQLGPHTKYLEKKQNKNKFKHLNSQTNHSVQIVN